MEKIVETGELDPDHIHPPGIFVHRIVLNTSPEKRIESSAPPAPPEGDDDMAWNRDQMAARAARELQDGFT